MDLRGTRRERRVLREHGWYDYDDELDRGDWALTKYILATVPWWVWPVSGMLWAGIIWAVLKVIR